jgi:hypothetical protein
MWESRHSGPRPHQVAEAASASLSVKRPALDQLPDFSGIDFYGPPITQSAPDHADRGQVFAGVPPDQNPC